MNELKQLGKFSEDFLQEVISASESDEGGEFRINEFTRLASDYLIEAGEIEDITVCYFKSRGMHVNGYNVNQDEDCLDLFISIFNQKSPPSSVTRTAVITALKQTEEVFIKGIKGHFRLLEESSEVYDMFLRIFDLRSQILNIRIYFLTDGIVKADDIKPVVRDGINVSFQVWDVQRLYRLASSGRKYEPIEIDFETEFQATIPCLPLADNGSDYKGYLAVIPGAVLAGAYDKYGPRLLERNVRSFLQARGNVNKGIRKTIIEEPHRFFAYNNGITATADEIEFSERTDGVVQIKKVRNLQIVNGGQTTASLHYTTKKDKVSLEGIYVQAKISVIPPEYIDEIVPLISRYANSQNKVNDADFYANDPFHIRIEGLSRTIWAPAVQGTSKQTRWFYERARGQYLDAKGKEITAARKRQFDLANPNSQKFTKTDLAKFENTWMQLPHIVSLGAQKNFINFSISLKENDRREIETTDFEHLIAKALLFKRAEKLIGALNYGGYRANIVTYTIAWLSFHTSQRIDLPYIWKKQELSPALQAAIIEVSQAVHQVIVNPPDGRNVTEWCKRKECWEKVRGIQIPLNKLLSKELIKG